jgi:hypothetical protein
LDIQKIVSGVDAFQSESAIGIDLGRGMLRQIGVERDETRPNLMEVQ